MPIEERVPINGTTIVEVPNQCATCSEKTLSICGRKVKRWCLLIALLILLVTGCLIPLVIYAVRFGEATSCRLTYADDALVTEADMQRWMAKENWPLSVPAYDWKRRHCVCEGFEDKSPRSLLPTDEILVWIAPGDLVSLSDEGSITPPLDSAFVAAHRRHYTKEQHVKVCLRQQLVLGLWNIDSDVLDGGQHCHVSSGDGSSNVEQFFLGWDGSLYCGGSCTTVNQEYVDPSIGMSIQKFLTHQDYARPNQNNGLNIPRSSFEQYLGSSEWICRAHCISWAGAGTYPNCVEFFVSGIGSSGLTTIACKYFCVEAEN